MMISVQSLIPNCRGMTTLGALGDESHQGPQVTGRAGLPGSRETRSETGCPLGPPGGSPAGTRPPPRTVTLKTKPGARVAESFLLAQRTLFRIRAGDEGSSSGMRDPCVVPHFPRPTIFWELEDFWRDFWRDFWTRFLGGTLAKNSIDDPGAGENLDPRDHLFPQRSEIPRVVKC